MARLYTRSLFSLFIALVIASPASAFPFGDVIVFGDSLVDSGNTQNAAGGPGSVGDPAPASAGYFEGRFSNGPVFSDQVNQFINGSNLTESTLGGTNYSFGGARARDNSPADGLPDVAAQGAAYLSVVSGAADPTALYIINAGGNDVRDILLGADLATTIGAAVTAIASTVSALEAAGAEHILVAGVGNVGGIPETIAVGPAAEAAGRAVSEAFNSALFPALAPLAGGLTDLFTLDVIALFDSVLADPAAFGLPSGINLTEACLSDVGGPPGGPPTCDDYAFFDTIHPTSVVHGLIADRILQLVPEPGTATLVMLGLVGMRAARRRSAAA